MSREVSFWLQGQECLRPISHFDVTFGKGGLLQLFDVE